MSAIGKSPARVVLNNNLEGEILDANENCSFESENNQTTSPTELNIEPLRVGSAVRYRQITGSSNTSNTETIEIQMLMNPLDPLNLAQHKKTDEELADLKTSSKSKKKLLIKFYQDQNDLIDEMLAPLGSFDEAAEESHNLKVNIAIYGSVAANVVLLCLQTTAAILSGSLSIFATMADAFMDILSSSILLITSYLATKSDVYKYPIGKARFETVGIVVFGSLMATVSLELIVHATSSLLGKPESPDLGILSILLVGISLATKFCLFLYCRLQDDPSCRILAQDHRNDLVVNSVGLTLAILGSRVNPYLDPVGGILVAIVILCSWSSTVVEHCQLIVGKCADSIFLKKITYIAMTHDEQILQIDTCRAYHAGSKVIVEVDVVLPPETTLQVAHDLGESLQIKLESLSNVDRAFVHCDYETTHTPEHRHRKFV